MEKDPSGKSASRRRSPLRVLASAFRRLRWFDEFTLVSISVILLVFSVVIWILKPQFMSAMNLTNIMKQASVPLILGIGLTFVIIAGSIDLSIEGNMALSAVVLSLLVLNHRNTNDLGLFGLAIALVVGTSFGLLSGLLFVRLRIPSFLVTFGIWNITLGLAVVLNGGSPITIKDPGIRSLVTGNTLGIPNLALCALGILVAGLFLQVWAKFGRYAVAIGENEEYARLSGIPVDFQKVLFFTFAGFCFAVGGILNAGRIGAGTSLIGGGFLFPVMAGVIMGGNAVTGGVGGVLNTLVGTLVMVVLSNGMILLRVNEYAQSTIIGLVVVAAVAVTIDRSKLPLIK